MSVPLPNDVWSALSAVERAHVRLVLASIDAPAVDTLVRQLQSRGISPFLELLLGAGRKLEGLGRLPTFDPAASYLCVANHRTFFDLFAVTSYLQTHTAMPHRIWFPVRAPFFYDNPLGIAVNAMSSAFAMYPPVFRDKKRASLNERMLDETIRLLRTGGAFVGLHPEGQRNKSSDPHQLLPARWGVGKVIAESGAWVLPVWVDGLASTATEQLRRAAERQSGVRIVFGAPYKPEIVGRSREDYLKLSQDALARVGALGRS